MSLAVGDARNGRAPGELVLLLLLGAIILGAGIGLRDPWAPDEPRFVLIARDMLDNGNWLFPTRGGELYSDKPPLYFWLTAAALELVGSERIAFLLPSLLAGLVTLGLVWDLARRLWGPRTALAAGILLLLTVQFTQHARAAHIDALLCMWTTLSLYGLLRHLLLGPSWGWYAAAWLAAGLGIITKGVGFLALFALLPCAWAWARGWDGVTRGGAWRWWAGACALLLPLAAWLVPLLTAAGAPDSQALAAYRDDILLRQTVERYAEPWGHLHPWWYFATVIPWAWLPVSALLPWLVPAWARDLRARDPRTLLLLGTAVIVLIFFSASPGKRGVYLLPAVPMIVLAAAPHVERMLGRRAVQLTGFACTALVALLFAGAAAYLALGGSDRNATLAADYGVAPLTVALVFAALAAGWLTVLPRRGALAFCGAVACAWLAFGWWLAPRIDATRSSAKLIAATEADLAPDEALGIVRYREQFLLQARRPITHFGYRRADTEAELHDAVGWLAASARRRLLVDDDSLRRCFRTEGQQPVGFAAGHHWYLVREQDLSGACPTTGPLDQAVVYRSPRG
jgi:4-amino-4-deoxy-L-arabinose transferase-like glycosyltransferase